MASSGLVIEDFSAVSGLKPSTWDRMLRPLREAEMVPMGERGRGQQGGQYERPHLGNALLACAALQPSESAEVARVMRGWRYGWTEPQDEYPDQRPVFEGETLGDVLEGMIDGVAKGLKAEADGGVATHADATLPRFSTIAAANGRRLPHPILFVPASQNAQLFWARSGKRSRVDWYVGKGIEGDLRDAPATLTRNAVTRQTSISHVMITTAGELWADTLARRNGDAAMLEFLRRRRESFDQR